MEETSQVTVPASPTPVMSYFISLTADSWSYITRCYLQRGTF